LHLLMMLLQLLLLHVLLLLLLVQESHSWLRLWGPSVLLLRQRRSGSHDGQARQAPAAWSSPRRWCLLLRRGVVELLLLRCPMWLVLLLLNCLRLMVLRLWLWLIVPLLLLLLLLLHGTVVL
jgi:hypothetical protein